MFRKYRGFCSVILVFGILSMFTPRGYCQEQVSPSGDIERGLVIEHETVEGISGEISIEVKQNLGDVYAVIIGIGDYQDKRIPPLRFTINDAQGLYDVLIDPLYRGLSEDHIKLLLGQDATDRKIKRAIGRWLSHQAKEDDTVIIYYSGHGAPDGEDTYWVTYNADIDDLYTTALSNNDICEMLDRIKSKRVITFLDACYSAATVNRKNLTKNIQVEIPWEKFSGVGKATISASDGKQLSLELEQYQHGLFTYYLLEGLKGQADQNRDGVVEVDEIWNYVKYHVKDVASEFGNSQTPVFKGSVTAGIPLTMNKTVLKLNKLREFLTLELIELEHFNRAYKMLISGESDPLLDGLLLGKIAPEVFNDAFNLKSIPLTPPTSPAPMPTPSPTPRLKLLSTPISEPTVTPTQVPTATPTRVPTATPTERPTATPTAKKMDKEELRKKLIEILQK